MNKPYVQITYREGEPFAAYLCLDRKPGDTAARTERRGSWLVDFAADGHAIGVEFTRPGQIDLCKLNQVLASGQQPAISIDDLAPLSDA